MSILQQSNCLLKSISDITSGTSLNDVLSISYVYNCGKLILPGFSDGHLIVAKIVNELVGIINCSILSFPVITLRFPHWLLTYGEPPKYNSIIPLIFTSDCKFGFTYCIKSKIVILATSICCLRTETSLHKIYIKCVCP